MVDNDAYMPIFLIGIYKFIDKNIKIETKNEWLIEFIGYLNRNKNAENKLVYKFTGEIDFLNNILHKDYNSFSNEYLLQHAKKLKNDKRNY